MSKVPVLILLLLLARPSNAGWENEVIQHTINTRFETADSIIRAHRVDEPLKAAFYNASLLNSLMTHYEDTSNAAAFLKEIDSVITWSWAHLEDSNEKYVGRTAQSYFYLGSAYGFRAYFFGKTGKWMAALRDGALARRYLNKAVEEDSTCYDAYMGLGTYTYWLNTKINWLPLVPDERAEGIRLIRKTANNVCPSSDMARHQLVYILLDDGQHEAALKNAEILRSKYPNSIFVSWAYSHVKMKMRRYDEAIRAYQNLLALIKNDARPNPNHERTALIRLADMYARSGQCLQAREIVAGLEKKFAGFSGINDDEVERLMAQIKESCL